MCHPLCLQIQGSYSDVTANTLYDVLHDPHYRKSWDPYLMEGFDICRISANSDIGYYASEWLSLSQMLVYTISICFKLQLHMLLQFVNQRFFGIFCIFTKNEHYWINVFSVNLCLCTLLFFTAFSSNYLYWQNCQFICHCTSALYFNLYILFHFYICFLGISSIFISLLVGDNVKHLSWLGMTLTYFCSRFFLLTVRVAKPLMNRDFVTQRSWLDLGEEKFILNHSVNHAVRISVNWLQVAYVHLVLCNALV